MVDALPSPLTNTQGCRACPTVTATPEAVKAAFTKEGDLFAEMGVRYLDTVRQHRRAAALREADVRGRGRTSSGSPREENHRAVEAGYDALEGFERDLRAAAREMLEQLERENRLGVVVLGRPYHNDPGVNHEILDEFQKLGYPVVHAGQPADRRRHRLAAVRRRRARAGASPSRWTSPTSGRTPTRENTSRKVWAAKYTARHPNLVALELSLFKCGHDAPIYATVEEIVESSGTPYFCFKDIDENKPTGSIKIRVETIGYFLKRYREDMVREADKRRELDERMAEFERRLRDEAGRGEEVAVGAGG